MDILFLIIGLFLGLSLGWFVAKSKFQNSNNNAEKSDQLLELQTKLAIAEERSQNLLKDSEKLKLDLENSRSENQNLQNQLTRTETEYRNIQKRLEEQKTELTELNEKFAAEFKNLANEIFEEKSKKFTDQNKTNLGELLNPLKEAKVLKAYFNES